MQKQQQALTQEINGQYQKQRSEQDNQIQYMHQADGQNQSDPEVDQEQGKVQYCIVDPKQFLNYCKGNKKIKIMTECNPIMPHVYLLDISLHKKGPLEDKIYSKNNMYYCNIRRGNTLCQIYEQGQHGMEEKSLFMCRRGMKKFYDLQPEYMKVNRKLTHQHERYRKRIFQKLDQLVAGNSNQQNTQNDPKYKIHLYTLFKQNGEHCQITYVKNLGYWLFASKNVAILAKNQQDLIKNYQKQRFYWAKLIGHQFFKILGQFDQKQRQQFIVDIDGKTLLGEHCGYEEHQHITRYDKIELIFYGLVQNNGLDHCLPVQQCQNFLKKYNLKMSRKTEVLNLTEKNKIYYSMYKMLKQIAEGTMQQCGEGSVMYIVAEDQQGRQRTVGMCKLKTCQYLIYRKMREMIKINFAKRGATANTFQKFKFQIQSLCASYFKPPKPLEYYYQIAEEAFKQIRINGKDFSDNQFRYKFVNFLESIQKKAELRKQQKFRQYEQNQPIRRIIVICPPLLSSQYSQLQKLCKKKSMAIENAYRQNPPQVLTKSCLHLVHMVPRLNVSQYLSQQSNSQIVIYLPTEQSIAKTISQLQNLQINNLKKPHLINFIKSQDKAKAIALLNQKIKGFWENWKKQKDIKQNWADRVQLFTNFQQALKAIEFRKATAQKQDMMKQKQQQQVIQNKQQFIINVILTMLIPGSGKSSLAQAIQNNYPQLEVKIISSDKIRQGLMEKYKSKRKGDEVESEQAFSATKKKALEKYRQTIRQEIGEQPPQQNRILFVDRIFCPTTVSQDIIQISKPWTRFIILTHLQIPTKINEFIYPHSVTYLLGCIKRSLQRQQHETLSIKPNEIVKVVLKFYQMYRNWGYNRLSRQLQENAIQFQILQLEFLKDKQQADNLYLKKKIQECLKIIPPGHDAPESSLYIELIELIYKYSQHIERKKTEETQAEKQRALKYNAEKVLKVCKI